MLSGQSLAGRDDFCPLSGDNWYVPPPTPLRVGMLAYSRLADPEQRLARSPMESIRRALKARPDLDILVAPEWFLGGPARFAKAGAVERFQRALEAETAGRSTLVVPGSVAWVDGKGSYRNTALAVSDGQTLLRYDKRSDGFDDDLAQAQGYRYAPGTEPGLFEWNGRRAGLEICLDHTDRRLAGDLAAAGAEPLDLQLVVSAGVWPKASAAVVREGGVVLSDEATLWGPQVLTRLPGEERQFRVQSVDEELKPVETQRLGNGVQLQVFDT